MNILEKRRLYTLNKKIMSQNDRDLILNCMSQIKALQDHIAFLEKEKVISVKTEMPKVNIEQFLDKMEEIYVRYQSQSELEISKKLNELVQKTNKKLNLVAKELNKVKNKYVEDIVKISQDHIKFIQEQVDRLNLLPPQKGDPGKDAKPEDVVPLVLEKIPPYAGITKEEVIDMLEAQKQDFERILARLQVAIKQSKKGGGASGGGGDIIRIDDFTGDGSTKVFTLSQAPRSIRKIMVHSSDWPNILRPEVDFTLSGKILTMTSEVDAPSNTATIVIQYVV